jgi:hypothetical protein
MTKLDPVSPSTDVTGKPIKSVDPAGTPWGRATDRCRIANQLMAQDDASAARSARILPGCL